MRHKGGLVVGRVRVSGSERGEPVELGDDADVTSVAGGQRFAQARSVAGGSGKTVIHIDPVGSDAERGERGALHGAVLPVKARAWPVLSSVTATVCR